MLKLFLWFRYLRKKKIVLLSILAVTLSVTLMIVTDSLFTGYIDALGKMILSDMGDALIWNYGGKPIENYPEFLKKLKEHPYIETAAPFHYGAGLLYVAGADVRAVTLYGLNPKNETGFNNWDEKLLRQKNKEGVPDFSVPDKKDVNGIWLGINIIAEPNEQTDEYDFQYAKSFIGKKVILTTMGHNNKRVVRQYRVSDIVFSKSYFGDKTAFMPFEQLQQIDTGIDKNNTATFIKLKLKNRQNLQKMEEDIRSIWNDYAVNQMGLPAQAVPALHVELRQRMYKSIFEDLRNQLRIVLLIFGVICSVAVLLIFCIFYMIVTAKQKDIAIIKSCGASSTSAASIFAGFGACVGIIGSAIGVILAIVITTNSNVLEGWVRVIFQIKLWRTSSYGLAEIPHHVHWPIVLPVILAAIVGCVLGVLIPAVIAARTKPVKILRYE